MASLEKRQERDSGGRKYCAIVVKVLIIPIHQKVALLGIWNAKRSLKIPIREKVDTNYLPGGEHAHGPRREQTQDVKYNHEST